MNIKDTPKEQYDPDFPDLTLWQLFYGKKDDWYVLSNGSTKDWTKSKDRITQFWNQIKIQKIDKGDFDFSSIIFPEWSESSWQNYNEVIVESEVSFEDCQFMDSVNFSSTKFKGKVNFSFSKFLSSADFSYCQFQDLSLFQSTIFFDIVTFEYSEFKSISGFDYCLFKSDSVFRQCVFVEEVSFLTCQFKGKTVFTGSSFKNRVDFWGSQFQDELEFIITSFLGNVSFRDAKFNGFTDFKGTSFLGKLDFTSSQFWEKTHFIDVRFGCAFFNSTYFSNDYRSVFISVRIEEMIVFEDIVFSSKVHFQNCDLSKVKITSCDIASVNFSNSRFPIKYNRLFLINDNGKDSLDLISTYRQIKRNRVEAKDWATAGDAYRSEMVQTRNIYKEEIKKGNYNLIFNWVILGLYDILSGFGQSISQPIRWLVMLLIFVPMILYVSDLGNHASLDVKVYSALITSLNASFPLFGKIEVGAYPQILYFVLAFERAFSAILLLLFAKAVWFRYRM